MPLAHDCIHTDYEPVVRGLRIQKGVVYKHHNGKSNNIDKGSAVQLPFLYQAPSTRQRNGVSPPQPNTSNHRSGGRREKGEAMSLPPIPNLPSSSKEEHSPLADMILMGTSKPLNPKNSTSSESSTKTARKSVRLMDDLRTRGANAFDRPRVFGHVGLRQNGIIVKTQPTEEADALNVVLPERAKSALDVRPDEDNKLDSSLVLKPDPHSISTQSLRETAERATQTVMYKAAASVEYLGKNKSIEGAVILRRKSEVPYSPSEIVEKEALLDVIDDALGETIDKYSRQRTNEIIARSARKQAEIWRDAKDFVTSVLLPQSVLLANKSKRRRQTAAEIVGNIKMYP